MPIRLSGLASNMDTDAIIKELMSAQSLKKIKIENKKTKLEWQQDKWKDLNNKIYKFYTDQASVMRLQGSYQTKKAASSDETVATVTASKTAIQGAYKLEVNKMASTQYVTGDDLSSTITGSSSLMGALGVEAGTVYNFTSGTGTSQKTAVLNVDANTTVNDFVQKCKEAGINASYDTAQKRFFLSSKASGEANTFTVKSSKYGDANALTYRDNIRSLTNYTNLGTTAKSAIDNALSTLQGASGTDIDYVNGTSYDAAAATPAQKLLKGAVDTLNTAVDNTAKATANTYATQRVKNEIKSAIVGNSAPYTDVYEGMKTSIWSSIQTSNGITSSIADGEAAVTKVTDGTATEEEQKLATLYGKYQTELNKQVDTLASNDLKNADNVTKITTLAADIVTNGLKDTDNVTVLIPSATSMKADLITNVKSLASQAIGTDGGSNLSKLGLGDITGVKKDAVAGVGMVVVAASDAEIVLNGATLTGTTNAIDANGLTINLKSETIAGKPITFEVSDSTQTNYDMIKKFVTEYNTLLKDMNTLYYAGTAKGYEPLTDEQKESMTDDQIEKWETKIKDSILRRDSKLGGLTYSMKSALAQSVDVNGEKISLSTYGIMTSTDYTEKGLLHIYGDSTDSTYSGKKDKLMAALKEDPAKVAEAFSKIATNLYKTMNDKMQGTVLNSALKFYIDKQITNVFKGYSKGI
jgi:flagellar hook-associated protein 2